MLRRATNGRQHRRRARHRDPIAHRAACSARDSSQSGSERCPLRPHPSADCALSLRRCIRRLRLRVMGSRFRV